MITAMSISSTILLPSDVRQNPAADESLLAKEMTWYRKA